MPNILALDTSTEACSVAVLHNGDVISERHFVPKQHAQLVLQMTERLLQQAQLKPSDLDAIVFGHGPGSFTGVRIAVAAAQGLAMSVGCRLVGVSTLQAMALQCAGSEGVTHCLAAIDARMQQVYYGHYHIEQGGLPILVDHEVVADPGDVAAPANYPEAKWHACGSGAVAYAEQFIEAGYAVDSETAQMYPDASDMLTLALPEYEAGNTVAPANAVPVYLRNKVALTVSEQEKASSSDS